jgi:hypothetical protein
MPARDGKAAAGLEIAGTNDRHLPILSLDRRSPEGATGLLPS